jgi:hypothetical protein
VTRLILWINGLPRLCFYFIYRREYDGEKARNWRSSEYWFRELFHFLGGVLLALPFFAIPTHGIVFVSAFAAGKECEEITAGFQWKNIVDWAAWTAGAVSVGAIKIAFN